MAKDKKWIDCPVCGASGSMVLEKNRTFESNIKDLGTLKVTKLFGYFCKECNDGIYHISSENKIEEAYMRLKAQVDSTKVKVNEVVSIKNIMEVLEKSRQEVYRMMKTGILPYVLVAGEIHPYKKTVEEAIRRKKAGRTKTRTLHVGTGKHLRAMEGKKPGRAALK